MAASSHTSYASGKSFQQLDQFLLLAELSVNNGSQNKVMDSSSTFM